MKRFVVALLSTLLLLHSAHAGQGAATAKRTAAPAVKLAATPKAKAAPKPAPAVPKELHKAPYEAYAVAEAESGTVFEGLNMHLKWYQASLTKLMLACVVMDRVERGELQLADRVTVSKRAEGMGGTQVFLKAGESFTLEELMQAALIESANDAAYAIAEHAAGSAEAFVELMNRKAHRLGMEDTAYYGVHGLPAAAGGHDNVTTCNDMIRLAREALRHPKVLEWTSTEQAAFRSGTLTITNKNKLVGRLPAVDGLKTGYTRKAGFNIVATGASGERRLIVVVLGSPESKIRDRFAADKFREYLTN
ncbi:MAG: D-alanyl-D-alanine carboxypeptidase [Desulfobacterales bacterium]|jgi:D-alanyl-D-alanine carboxypeptidase (penicillin-binding protein 5/6)|nr:D-alanyl-D-alanine carboxypeptidase [Desulfobacterales bacterium]